jgi:hypothetical protein
VIFHHLPFNENNSPAIAEMNARGTHLKTAIQIKRGMLNVHKQQKDFRLRRCQPESHVISRG